MLKKRVIQISYRFSILSKYIIVTQKRALSQYFDGLWFCVIIIADYSCDENEAKWRKSK